MKKASKNLLSDTSTNILENLALLIAERNEGCLTVNHLMPYLPVSFELIKLCLDNMVDGSAVIRDDDAEFPTYHFTAHKGATHVPGILIVNSCIACDCDIRNTSLKVLCAKCFKAFKKELTKLAERMGWPAQAVYEHEIIYLAAKYDKPHYAGQLAGHSRYTLGNLRGKLEKLCVEKYINQEMDEEKGVIAYNFPEIDYPQEMYHRNMELIRSYPASIMEEIELKLVRIIFTLAGLILLTLLCRFVFRVPFAISIFFLLILGPILSLRIWFYKSKAVEE